MTKVIRHEFKFKDGIIEEYYRCSDCGGEVNWFECDSCNDGHSHHDCGEDTCICLEPTDNVVCTDCNGKAGWWRCYKCDKYIDD